MIHKGKYFKRKIRSFVLSLLTIVIVLSGMTTSVSAEALLEGENVFSSPDGLVAIQVLSENLDSGNEQTLKFNLSSKQNAKIDDIQYDGQSINHEDYRYTHSVGSEGNYKYTVYYTVYEFIESEDELINTDSDNLESYEEIQKSFDFIYELDKSVFDANEDEQVDDEVIQVIDQNGNFKEVSTEDIELESGQSLKEAKEEAIEKMNEYSQEDLATRLDGKGKWVEGTFATHVESDSGVMSRSVGKVVNVTLGPEYVRNVDFQRNPDHPDYDPSYAFYDWAFGKMTVDGEAVFCLDPETQIPTGIGYVGTTDWGSLSRKQRDDIIAAINYGYGFNGDYSDEMHWATQNLVWEIAGWNVTWGTLNASTQYQTIKNRMASHLQRPGWHSTTKDVKVGDIVDLSDSILSDFNDPTSLPTGLQIVENSGNTFKVKVLPGFKEGTIKMTKKSANVQGTSVVYRKPGEQTFLKAYNEDPVQTSVTLRVKSANFRVYKTGENGEPLAGHKFRFSYSNSVDENGILNGTHWDFVTGADGYTPYEPWNNDGATVYVQEIYAKDPYLLNKEIKSFVVEAGTTKSLNFTNVKATGSISITKLDNHRVALQHVVFGLYDTNGNLINSATTDVNGKISFSNLQINKSYVAKEISVPGTIVLSNTEHHFTLTYQDQHTSVVLVNREITNKYQRSNLTITKVEDNTDSRFPEYHGIKLSGATIELYAKTDIYEGSTRVYREGQLIGTRVTNNVGQVTFHNLPIGNYYAKEKISPEGYKLFQGQWDISIKYDGNKVTTEITETAQTVTNTAIYGNVELTKRDSKYGDRLKGAEFELRYKGKLVGTYTSDEDGRIFVDKLRYSTGGSYSFHEIAAPDKYYMSTEPIVFDITEDGKTVYVDAPNVLIETHIQFRKLNEEFKPLAGVGFSIRDVDTGEFVTLSYAFGGEIIEESIWYTNEDGKVFVEGLLVAGNYELIEVKPLPGYQPIAPIPFTVDENSDFIDLGVRVGLSLDLGDIINEWNRGTIRIQKLDATTGLPLAGFGFNIYDLEGNLVSYLETDEDGIALLPDNIYGLYTVEEVKAVGDYVIDYENNKQTVFVENHNETYTVTFKNVETHIVVRKLDSQTKEPIPGTIFEFYQNGTLLFEKETDENGEIKLSGYDFSTITVKEVFVPEPWILDSGNNTAEVTLTQDTPVYEIEFINDRAVGEDRIIKRDAKNNEVISGVTYNYYDITDWNITDLEAETDDVTTLLTEDVVTEDVEVPTYEGLLEEEPFATVTTDESGEAVLENLDIQRKYVRIEVDAPYGYEISKDVNVVQFEYVDQHTPVITNETELFNERIKVVIHGEKRDKLTKNLITTDDFVLTLKDKDGNIIEHIMFKDGVYTWEVDALEIYKLSETDAPQGYIKSDEIIEIDTSVQVDGNIYTIEYLNEMMPTTIKLPATGISGGLLPPIGLMSSLLGALMILMSGLKRRFNELLKIAFSKEGFEVENVYVSYDSISSINLDERNTNLIVVKLKDNSNQIVECRTRIGAMVLMKYLKYKVKLVMRT